MSVQHFVQFVNAGRMGRFGNGNYKKDVIEKASQNGVNFDNVDSWTFIMKPDGTYSFMLNDLLNINTHESISPALKERNERSLETFTYMLENSRQSDEQPRGILSYWASGDSEKT